VHETDRISSLPALRRQYPGTILTRRSGERERDRSTGALPPLSPCRLAQCRICARITDEDVDLEVRRGMAATSSAGIFHWPSGPIASPWHRASSATRWPRC